MLPRSPPLPRPSLTSGNVSALEAETEAVPASDCLKMFSPLIEPPTALEPRLRGVGTGSRLSRPLPIGETGESAPDPVIRRTT